MEMRKHKKQIIHELRFALKTENPSLTLEMFKYLKVIARRPRLNASHLFSKMEPVMNIKLTADKLREAADLLREHLGSAHADTIIIDDLVPEKEGK
jgi:hypothetical protein